MKFGVFLFSSWGPRGERLVDGACERERDLPPSSSRGTGRSTASSLRGPCQSSLQGCRGSSLSRALSAATACRLTRRCAHRRGSRRSCTRRAPALRERAAQQRPHCRHPSNHWDAAQKRVSRCLLVCVSAPRGLDLHDGDALERRGRLRIMRSFHERHDDRAQSRDEAHNSGSAR